MAIFFVTALKESQAEIDAAIKEKFPDNVYVVGPDKWFISADATTARELSDKLGITGIPASQSTLGVVISVAGYFGRAQPDMWEWIAAKSTKSDA